jgi:hypothetical protein
MLFLKTIPLVITRIHRKAEKDDKKQQIPETCSGHLWSPFFPQGVALSGFPVRSRARQKIRLENTICRVFILYRV